MIESRSRTAETNRLPPRAGSGIGYAHGLDIGSHRGCPWVGHGGADAGFRSQVIYFPEQNVSCMLLATLTTGLSAVHMRANCPGNLEHRWCSEELTLTGRVIQQRGVVLLSNLASEDPGRRAIAVAEAVVEASGRSFREPPAARASVMAPSPPGRPAVTHDAGRERAEQLSGQYYSAELETTLTVAGPGGRGGMGSKLVRKPMPAPNRELHLVADTACLDRLLGGWVPHL